jgi:hypothetical protein
MVTKELGKVDDQIEGVMMKPAGVVGKAVKSDTGKALGGIAFIVGFGLAVLAGLLAGLQAVGVDLSISIEMTGLMTAVLALIGLIVGLVNVSDKNAINFLIGAIAVSATSASLSPLATLGMGLEGVAVFITTLMAMVAAFVAPAAVIVGLKVIYSSARGK